MPGAVDWIPGLVVLAAGLAGGFFLVRRLVGAPAVVPAGGHEAIDRRDLLARRDVLIDQLRELHGAAEAADERGRLEREAAQVLRDIDRLDTVPAPRHGEATAGAAGAPRPDRAALRGFLWGTGSAAAVALLLFLVSRSATEREAGGSVTGEVPGAATGAPDAETARLQQAVASNPDDLDARMALARHALAQQDMMTVYDQTRAILEKEPGHARALSYQALVRLAMGQADVAERMLGEALKNDPDLLEGYIHLSLVHLRQGRLDAAEKDIEEAARRHPAQAARLRALWADMRAQTESAPPPAAAAQAEAGGIAGTVELEGSAPAPGAILFVTVRPAGATSGPPVAAKRLPAAAFPVSFAIGAGDSMMGQALPARVRLEARVDGDGDPITRDPADPVASADDVPIGATGVRLVLRRSR